MKDATKLAREFIGLIDGLNSVPGMMTSHDTGKEAIARALLAVVDAQKALDAANARYEDSDDQSTDWQHVYQAEERLCGLLDSLVD